MLKPMIATSLLFISLYALASEQLPTVEFIHDGEVVESRQMSSAEYQAYRDLQNIDAQIEVLTAPIEAMEERIESKAELIEAQVERSLEQRLSDVISGEVDVVSDVEMSELNEIIAQIKPQLEQIDVMAEQISDLAEQFEGLILSDYQRGEIDRVRIISEGDNDNVHFE